MNYNNSVKIQGESSRNAFGEQVWDSGVTVKARVIETSSETLDLRGNKTMSDLVVHLPLDETAASIGDLITYNDVEYLILEVKKPQNEVGHIRDIKLICKKHG